MAESLARIADRVFAANPNADFKSLKTLLQEARGTEKKYRVYECQRFGHNWFTSGISYKARVQQCSRCGATRGTV